MTTDHDVNGGSQDPVFICGADRSGTSLMYALLASHPNLSMVRRTNMWRWFHGKFGDLANPGNAERALATMERYERFAVLEPDWETLRSEFRGGAQTYGRLFELLHRPRAERLGRPRWGDKSLHSEYFADAIFDEFPNARVIHTIRDPRDRHASIVNRYDSDVKGIGAATGRWLASARMAHANAQKYPDRYLVVRFEDLAARPREVVQATCAFIGEPFVEEMMAMRGVPEHTKGNSSFGELPPNTISTRPIGRYKTVLSASDVVFVQLATRPLMKRFGYDLDPVALGGVDRLRFATTEAPQGLARLVLWSVRDRLGRSKATVPAHRLRGGEGSSPAGRDAVTYITGTYPMLTTTFIDREVRMLRARGVEIDVVSLRRPPEKLSPEQRTLVESTSYVRPVKPWTILRRHLGFLRRSPRRYVAACWHLVGGRGQTAAQRLRSVGHFALAVHVAGEIDERGSSRHLHAHFIDRAAAVTLVAARLLDVPYSVTAHASDIYVEPVLLEEKIASAAFVTTCTAHNKTHLCTNVDAADPKVELLYHGLELDRYVPAGPSDEQPPLLLSVGQLKEKKGFVHLLAACRILDDKGIAFRCEIVGEGPQREELEAAIHQLQLEDLVTLRGALQHDDVIDAYRRATAFVLPCVVAENGDRDGIPNVILEAMAMQLPVVSTTVSGIPEAVADDHTGALVEPADADALAAALIGILEDPRRAVEMGENGRRVVEERFDAERNVDALHRRFTAARSDRE